MSLSLLRLPLYGITVCLVLAFTTLAEAQNRRPPASGNRAATPAIKPDDPYFYRKVGLSPEGVKLADEAMTVLNLLKARANVIPSLLPKKPDGSVDWDGLRQSYVEFNEKRTPIGNIASGFSGNQVARASFFFSSQRADRTFFTMAFTEWCVNLIATYVNSLPAGLDRLPYDFARPLHRVRTGAWIIFYSAYLPGVPSITARTRQEAFALGSLLSAYESEDTVGPLGDPGKRRTEKDVMSAIFNAKAFAKPFPKFDLVATGQAQYGDWDSRYYERMGGRGGSSTTGYELEELTRSFLSRQQFGDGIATALFREEEQLSEKGVIEVFLDGLRTPRTTESSEFRNRLYKAAFAPFLK